MESKCVLQGKDPEAQPVMLQKPRKLSRTLHDLVSVRSVCVLLPGELDTYLFNMFMRDFLQVRSSMPLLLVPLSPTHHMHRCVVGPS